MATLTIPNISPATLAALSACAARTNRTVEEVALAAIEGQSQPVSPIRENGPSSAELLEYISSPEIPAPFDPEPSTPGVRVTARDCGPSKLEFWFDEDKVAE